MVIKEKYKKPTIVLITWLLVSFLLVSLIDSVILFSILAIAYTLLASIAFIFFVQKSDFSKPLKLVVLVGYFLRLLLDYINAFVIDMWSIFSPIGDAERFYQNAYDLFYGIDNTEGHVYPKLVAAVFRLTGPSELMAYYVSTFAWMIVIFMISRIYTRTKYNDILIAIYSFMPVTIWLNTSSLRESLQIVFLVLVTDFVLRWMDTGYFKYIIYSAIAILMATLLHFGVVFLYFSVLLLYCIWSCNKQKWHVSIKRTIISTLIIGLSIGLFMTGIFDNVQPYILSSNLKNGLANMIIDKFYYVSDSSYLVDFDITKYNFIFWVFLKWLYFWVSPVVWDMPGLKNWLIIVFDVIPIIFIYYICAFKSHANKYVKMGIVLTAPASFVYAMSTVAAGTAMRHRNIFLVILIICYIYGEKKAHDN